LGALSGSFWARRQLLNMLQTSKWENQPNLSSQISNKHPQSSNPVPLTPPRAAREWPFHLRCAGRPVHFIDSCVLYVSQNTSARDPLPIGGHRQFLVAGKRTSRCISPDYAAENGQGRFGIVTASLAKESRTKAGLDVTTFSCTQGCTCRPDEPGWLGFE